MQLVFINDCKSCEISIQIFFSVKMNWLWLKYCKKELFSGTILHGVFKEPDPYLERSQICAREIFFKNSFDYKLLTIFTKNLYRRCLTWFS